MRWFKACETPTELDVELYIFFFLFSFFFWQPSSALSYKLLVVPLKYVLMQILYVFKWLWCKKKSRCCLLFSTLCRGGALFHIQRANKTGRHLKNNTVKCRGGEWWEGGSLHIKCRYFTEISSLKYRMTIDFVIKMLNYILAAGCHGNSDSWSGAESDLF